MGVSPIPPAISLLPRDGCASGLRYRRGVGDYLDRSEAPAHPSNALIAQLNKNWRVVDDPLQWRLQRKKGKARRRNSGWQDRAFCTTRGALLRCVREYCGDVDTTALAKLAALSSDHAMRIPPGTPGPEGSPKMVCVPKLQTDLTVLGTAAASDRMADKPLVVVRLNCTKAMPPPGPCGRVWPRPTQSGTAKSSVIWFGFPVQPCEIRSEASPAASR